MEPIRKTNITLPESLHKRLRMRAATSYESISSIISTALEEYLDKLEKGGKK